MTENTASAGHEPATSPAPRGAADADAEFRLAVLNPGGRDRSISYVDGPGAPGDPGVPHPPVNFHGYAAATRGDFFQTTREALAGGHDAVLVLIRHKVGASLEAVRELKAAGRVVLVSWKEAGPYQITQQLGSSGALDDYQEVLNLADGVLSPCAVLPPRWGWISAAEFARKTRFIPTPYPLEFDVWDFSRPVDKRAGIFIGTREFFTPTRNHLRTLAESATLAADLGVPVTVINGDKRAGRRLLRQLEASFPEASLKVIGHRLPYLDYLGKIARHRLVFQLDRSAVPGQVAGDALMCRTLCAGGNTAIERVAFPELDEDSNGSLAPLFDRIRHLLTDATAYAEMLDTTRQRALETVSYGAVARQLEEFVATVKGAGS